MPMSQPSPISTGAKTSGASMIGRRRRDLLVGGGQHHGARPDADLAPDPDGARRVHVDVLADPGAVADDELPARVALEHRPVADVDVVAEVHRLRVPDEHALLDDAPGAEGAEVGRLEAPGAVRGGRHGPEG